MYYFLRWTNNPNDDIKRNFSGHMQAWFNTKQEAFDDYEKEKAKGRDLPFEPKQDPVSGMWNSDPEWGISGYLFNSENMYNQAMEQIMEIAWHHQENNGQDLALFSAEQIGDSQGYDGEELFRNLTFLGYIEPGAKYQEALNRIKKLNEIRKLIRQTIKQINS